MYDDDTGLHYKYFRDYDASIGRYIQSDPIGLTGGSNTYAYVGLNPVKNIDPFGIIEWDATITATGAGKFGFGSAYFVMRFVADCVDGRRADVSVHAIGFGIGIGLNGASTTLSETFEDFDVAVDPRNLEGTFRIISAGATISVPPFVRGGPGVGVSLGFTQVGGAFATLGFDVILGADLSAMGLRGTSWIIGDPKWEDCQCPAP